MKNVSVGEQGALPEKYLLALEELRTPSDYRAYRKELSAAAREVPRAWIAAAFLSDSTQKQGLAFLAASATQFVSSYEPVLRALNSETSLGEAAAVYFVEQYGTDLEAYRYLLLASSTFEEPRLNRFGRYSLLRYMGLSGQRALAPVLQEAVERQYHHCLPDVVVRSLQNLGIRVDTEALGYHRSITASQSGSRLLIHNDDRFSGSSNCPHCSFFPCRVNLYFRAPVEDCKLWNKVNPDLLLELKDYRPKDQRGPTYPEEDSVPAFSEALEREAQGLEAEGKLREAAGALRRAIRGASGENKKLDLLIRSIRLLVQAGERTSAYSLLTLAQDKARDAEDPSLLRLWDSTRLGLLEELGPYVGSGSEGARTPQGRNQASLLARFRGGPGRDMQELRAAVSMAEEYLERRDSDPVLSYRWLSYLASFCRYLGDAERTERAIANVFARPPASRFEALERQVISARQLAYRGELTPASASFSQLLAEVWLLEDSDRKMEYLGYAAEAFGLQEAPDSARLFCLTAEIRELFGKQLLTLRSAPSRRRLRERHQRTLESAVTAMVRLVEVSQDETSKQRALGDAWDTVAATRNPELQHERLALSEEDARKLRNLEDSLHRGLHYYLVEGNSRETFLDSFLSKVLDFEVAQVHRQLVSASVSAQAKSDLEGVEVLWFELRELAPSGTFLFLERSEKGFSFRWLSEVQRRIFGPLIRWQEFLKSRAGQSATVRREVSSPRKRQEAALEPDAGEVRRAVESLLPMAALRQGTGSTGCTLLPDGFLYALPIEALPDPTAPGSYLGERLASRYRLRRRTEPSKLLRLRRGWLGLGGVPEAPLSRGDDEPRWGRLADSRREIEALAQDLRSYGVERITTLLDEEGHLENLTKALEEQKPAVLHLAVHGSGDSEYPDACALVLAVEPGGAAGALLPFRLMRDLPLEGVQLVVLSACESLVGPGGAGTGTQGLAWALLEAGVGEVLASRYPVGDRSTGTFMRFFYRYLLDKPPAEALRLARVEALETKSVPVYDVGAWALWC